MSQQGFLRLGLFVSTRCWDGLQLGFLHEFFGNEGSVTWPKDTLLDVTLSVLVAHVVTPLGVGRVGLGSQVGSLFALLDHGVQVAGLFGELLPEEHFLLEVTRVGVVIQLGLVGLLFSETPVNEVVNRDLVQPVFLVEPRAR